jgi:protein-S-isoprenylcysteine O-methyltransferase Ste14
VSETGGIGGALFRWRLAVIVSFFAAALAYSAASLAHVVDVPLATLEDLVGQDIAFLVCGPLALVGFWLRASGEARLGSAVYGQSASARVVTGGPFRVMRHPLYAGTLLFFVATFAPYLQPALLAALAIGFALCLRSIAKYEERDMGAHLGDAWTKYAAAVPRFFGKIGAVDDDGIRPDGKAWALAILGNLALLTTGLFRILVGSGVMFRGLKSLNVLCIAIWIVVVVVRRVTRR